MSDLLAVYAGLATHPMGFVYEDWLGAPTWLWLAFAGFLATLLTFDLGVFHRRDREIRIGESLLLSTIYIGLGLAFGAIVWWRLGPTAGLAYLTGFIVEKTLSIDNIIVISMIFMMFSVPRAQQHRVLFWGILCAIVLRGVMIALGVALIEEFSWSLYIFSAFLIATGIRMLFFPGKETSIADNSLIRFMRSRFNVTDRLHGHHFFVRLPHPLTNKPTLFATPLFMALMAIEFADIIFAVDSLPAIFAITTDPFVVYTSNIFAILGLRALYFVLSAAIHHVRYLKPTLAAVLIFVGSKIFAVDLIGEEIPSWLSLLVTLTIIATGGLYSLWSSAAATNRWIWQMAAGAVAILIFAGGWLSWPVPRGAIIHYVTESIGRGPVTRVVSATGTIDSTTPAQIRAQLSGKIEALYCDPGTKVKAGQICARIDRRPYQIVVERENANLGIALVRLRKNEARLARAKAAFERNQVLAKRGAISRSVLAKSRNAHEKAQARAMRDEAEIIRRRTALHAAEADLAHVEIVSPIDGTVVTRNVEIGHMVGASTERPLFFVGPDFAIIQMDAKASAQDIGEIEPGDKASFTADTLPDRVFNGEVSEIRQTPRKVEDNMASLDVIISAPNPDLLLAPGMRATAKIVVDRRDDVTRVSDRAMRYAADRLDAGDHGRERSPPGWARLWIVRDGKPIAVVVRLGLGDGVYTEVLEGDLRLGDQLILGESSGRAERSTPRISFASILVEPRR